MGFTIKRTHASKLASMQFEMDSFSEACSKFGLTISTKKKEVMFQPPPGKQYIEPQITVNRKAPQAVESFTYLGSTLSRTATIDTEINNIISKSSVAFGRLREKVWERRRICLETKLKVYRVVVFTTLVYGAETWTVYRIYLRCLHSLLRIRWQDKISNTEVLQWASLPSITTITCKAQLRWAGHVSRMHDDGIPKQLFYRELCHSNGQSEANVNALRTVSKSL